MTTDNPTSSSSAPPASSLGGDGGILVSIGPLIYERLMSSIHADTSDPHRLSVGFIGGDIPIFPPIAFLLSCLVAFLVWTVTKKRCRILPNNLRAFAVPIRVLIMAIGTGCALSLANATEQELRRVGTIPNFAEVSKITNQGPYEHTRNGMYIALFLFQASLAIGFDTAWLLYLGVGPMMIYLDKIVVPAEERFLTRELGTEYEMYCQQVPRWLF